MDVAQLLVQDWSMKLYLAELEAIRRLQNLPSFRDHSVIEKEEEKKKWIEKLNLSC